VGRRGRPGHPHPDGPAAGSGRRDRSPPPHPLRGDREPDARPTGPWGHRSPYAAPPHFLPQGASPMWGQRSPNVPRRAPSRGRSGWVTGVGGVGHGPTGSVTERRHQSGALPGPACAPAGVGHSCADPHRHPVTVDPRRGARRGSVSSLPTVAHGRGACQGRLCSARHQAPPATPSANAGDRCGPWPPTGTFRYKPLASPRRPRPPDAGRRRSRRPQDGPSPAAGTSDSDPLQTPTAGPHLFP